METNQYLDMFLDESKEHLHNLNDHLLEWEQDLNNSTVVGEIFRFAHTLKGMAGTMGYEKMATLTHQFENVLDDIRNGVCVVTEPVIDLFFEALDLLEEMVALIESGKSDNTANVESIIDNLRRVKDGGAEPPLSTTKTSTENELDEFQRTVLIQAYEQGYQGYLITVTLREDCILKAARVFMIFEVLEKSGEVVKTNPSTDLLEDEAFDSSFMVTYITHDEGDEVKQKIMKVSEVDQAEITPLILEDESALNSETEQASDVKEPVSNKNTVPPESKPKQVRRQTKQASIRVNLDKLDQLMGLFEELVMDKARLEALSDEMNHHDLTDAVSHLARISDHLQDSILTLRMVPVEQVFNRFPKMVRSTAKELNKKIRLDMSGTDTELDRTVIDEIGDPLVHLIRNSIDHGIEKKEIRSKNGKPEEGTVKLSAYHSGNQVFIEIADDGGGIDKNHIIKKAVENEIVTAEETEYLSDREIFMLMFQPGFSTAEKVTDLSGRGVGLDVVRNKIEALGGRVEVHSELGKGTAFTIRLPLTLSIIKAMLVEVAGETYAIPLSSVIEIAVISNQEIMTIHDQELVEYRGRVIPVRRLQQALGSTYDTRQAKDTHTSLVIVKNGEQQTALSVDHFIGQQEIVIKSLGDYLGQVPAISGATILGNGQVAMILDTTELVDVKRGSIHESR